MAVYTWDVTSAEVAATIGFATISASSSPTTTQVTAWVTRYAAELGVELQALGITASTITAATNEELYQRCRQAIIQACSAEWHAGNQREDTELAQYRRDEWVTFLLSLRRLPSFILGKTTHTTGGTSSVTNTTPAYVATRFWKRDTGFG
jgi:hypothetical protein